MFRSKQVSSSTTPAIVILSVFFAQRYQETKSLSFCDRLSAGVRENVPKHTSLVGVSYCETPSIHHQFHNDDKIHSVVPLASPSKIRQFAHTYFWWSLPALPRRLASNDPVLTLTSKQKQQRNSDDAKQGRLLQCITSHVPPQASPPKTNEELQQRGEKIAKLQQEWLDVVYGGSVSLQDRQTFLEWYGCTGWTEEVLDKVVTLSGDTGIVEMGAGNGQWARAISEHYKAEKRSVRSSVSDYVLAFDNNSRLPLNPTIYHENTQPAHDHFGTVRDISSTSIDAVLGKWVCRGRALLLVYPPPSSSMAHHTLQKFDELGGTVLFYVGEGRGGATANDDFFDYLEDASNNWYLDSIVSVRTFGSKGFEKLFILRKM